MPAPSSFRRPAGVTVAAILLGLFSGLLVLGAAASALAAVALSSLTTRTAAPGSPAPPPHAVALLFGVSIAFHLALAGWGIATLVGLVRLRNWARISTLVIGAALTLVGLTAFTASLVARHVIATQPYGGNARSASFVSVLMVIYSVLWLGVAAVGTWFVVYFAARRTREVFRLTPVPAPGSLLPEPSRYATGPLDATHFLYAEPLPPPFSAAPPVRTPASPMQAHHPGALLPAPAAVKRPVSITVIAILLLAGAASLLFCLLFPFPLFVFGAVLSGTSARLVLVVWAVLSCLTGIGLLRLGRPAWWAAMALYSIGLINVALLAVPTYRLRVMDYSAGLNARLTQWIPQPPAAGTDPVLTNTHFAEISLVFGMVVGVAFTLLILLLLWRARWAFEPGALTPSATTSTTSSV